MLNITIPTLLLDRKRCLQNIEKMAEKAKLSHAQLRPHLKTPQSLGVAEWFKSFGVSAITVSSLRMAKYFADGGWRDITVAFPINILEASLIETLATNIQLNILVESTESLVHLGEQIHNPVGVFIKMDVGYHRTGVAYQDVTKIEAILDTLARYRIFQFKGFLTHAGHSYKITGEEAAQHIYRNHLAALTQLKNQFIENYPNLILSYSDTPSCSMLEKLEGADELRAGNFVFYDLMQYQIGACGLEDIAVAVACPVVALHPERSEIVVYGGGVHFSKDQLLHPNGHAYYGRVVTLDNDTWHIPAQESYMKSLSQEHGIIKASPDLMAQTKVGDILAVLPVHSCMTADLMPYYQTLDGERIDIWDKK